MGTLVREHEIIPARLRLSPRDDPLDERALRVIAGTDRSPAAEKGSVEVARV
jgi:hypothetical protein